MNLDLMPTEDLLTELETRFEHVAFLGMRGDDEDRLVAFRYRTPNPYVMIGLLDRVRRHLHLELDESDEAAEL